MKKLHVSSESLPLDGHERHSRLRDYFCDKDAVATKSKQGWDLDLRWPSGKERHIDEGLDEGLDWWSQGLKREKMALVHHRTGKLLRCLYDSWTLASWSEWLKRRGGPETLTSLVILHVDDHRDLSSPRLKNVDHAWTDLITGLTVSISEPETVVTAIESGAIGMGSFMTPFLAAVPLAEVRHLCQAPKATATRDYAILVEDTPDDLLEAGVPRPSIKLEYANGKGPGRYRLTPDLDDWLEGIQHGPLLFHIDMDYFNNRYDGDSDWRERPERLDPPLKEIFARIKALAQALDRRGLLEVIEDVVFAFSPGFFPAEFWQPVDEHLAGCLGLDAHEQKSRRSRSQQHKGRQTHDTAMSSNKTKSRYLASAEEVKLVATKGTKGRGGGADGDAWRIELNGTRAGQVFINLIDQPPVGIHASIQIYLNQASQGRGIGSLCYRWACERSRYDTIYAHMQKSNMASARAAEKAGFKDETSAQERQKLMVWRRSSATNQT